MKKSNINANKTKRRNKTRYKTRRRNKTLNKTRRKNRRRNNTRNKRVINQNGGSPRKWWLKRKLVAGVLKEIREIIKKNVNETGPASYGLRVVPDFTSDEWSSECERLKAIAEKTIKKKGKWSLRKNNNLIKRITNEEVQNYILFCCKIEIDVINTLIESLKSLEEACDAEVAQNLNTFIYSLKFKRDYENDTGDSAKSKESKKPIPEPEPNSEGSKESIPEPEPNSEKVYASKLMKTINGIQINPFHYRRDIFTVSENLRKIYHNFVNSDRESMEIPEKESYMGEKILIKRLVLPDDVEYLFPDYDGKVCEVTFVNFDEEFLLSYNRDELEDIIGIMNQKIKYDFEDSQLRIIFNPIIHN